MTIYINKILKNSLAITLIFTISIFFIFQKGSPDHIISDVSYSVKDKNFFEHVLSKKIQRIKLSFNFNYNKYQNHDNLFEIKPVSSEIGCCTIRMEFGKNYVEKTGEFSNDLALVIGGNNLVGTIIKRNVELDKSHKIDIEIYKGKIQVKYNGKPTWVNQHANLGDKFSKITVGYGYEKERFFNGTIENFSAKFYEVNSLWQKFFNVIIFIFILGLLTLLARDIKISDFVGSKYLKNDNQIELKLNIILIIIVIGFAVSIIYKIILVSGFNIGYPQNIPYMFKPNTTFGDYFTNYDQSILLETYWNKENAIPANYFPLAYILTYPLTLIDSNFGFEGRDIGLFIFLFTTFPIAFLINYYYLNKLEHMEKMYKKIISVIILSILNYAFLFCFDRANYEIILYVLISISLIFFIKRKFFSFIFFIILATMIKPYAAIFSLLLINVYDIKKSIIYYAVFTFLFFTIFIFLLFFFSGTFEKNFINLVKNFDLVNNVYNDGFLHYFSLSILEPIKYLDYFLNFINVRLVTNLIVYTTLMCSLVVFFMENYLWKKVAFLTCLIVCLTPIAYDYKLILFMLPILLFISSNEKESVEKNISYAVLFGLILIPKDYYYFVSIGDLVSNNYTSISVILNPILIYSLAVLLFFDMFKYVKDYFSKINLK
tara:strand:+ start:14854 stop:16827 length:1974 start_codon:yes stop_codon:yes gene_type:complete